jgi:nicotinate-nucleotide pyrophosphorylase (carboxylating)
MNDESFRTLLELALTEDLESRGDVTSEAIFAGETCQAVLTSKDTGTLCGGGFFRDVFLRVDKETRVSVLLPEGSPLSPGQVVARLSGRTKSVLEAERIAINFISFLSGIATATAEYVRISREKGAAVILDTRKTLPGYRELSKYAVRVGGGVNHRQGLYDMVLIKDNHIDAAGGILKAVRKVRERWGSDFPVEIECRTVEEVAEALDAGVDIVMLDNMDFETARKALALRPEGVLFEASGGVGLDTVGAWSELGVDRISVGRITHSVRAFDFSLTIRKDGQD